MVVIRRAILPGLLPFLLISGCAVPPPAFAPPVARIDAPPQSSGQHRPVPFRDAPGSARDAAARLDRLFAEDGRAQQALDPLGAMMRGDPVPRALAAMVFTPDLAARQRAVTTHALTELAGIDRDRLDPPHRLSYDVFDQQARARLALLSPAVQTLTGVQPFNHVGGFPVEFPAMAASDAGGSLRTPGDIEARLELERALPMMFDNAITRFREGMASGAVEPRLTVADMISQIDAILARPPATSLFMRPVQHLPHGTSSATRRRLTRAFLAVTTGSIYPAYRRLRTFLAQTYLPAARDSVGLSAIPGGAGLYRLLIREETTLDLDPDAVHRIGLDEVARIHGEMAAVERELGYSLPLTDFFEVIRTDPRFHPRSPEELGDGFRAVGARVARLAPRYFLHLPHTPLLIEPVPDYRARFEAGGSYSEGMPDGSRPGVFFYNTYDWKNRFITGIATLYLHEGAPGHHFQISLAQENADLPDFQRFGGNAAFVEGWALYAETLGYDMGLYADPMQHWGTLDDEMLRAMRLVVDTGLHAQGWTRDQAIAYMLNNSGIGRTDAAAEVDRYIANPGQALAYKIGAMTIQRLRDEARAALGARFDLREFHDQVLNSGALPLGVLETKIRAWIAARQPSPSASAISARVLAKP